jgi:hypothetical protein
VHFDSATIAQPLVVLKNTKNLLSDIEKIIDGDKKEAVELFKMANANQQRIIVDFLISKVANGEDIDMNTVSQIATISGVKIAEKATEAKEYSEILFNQK